MLGEVVENVAELVDHRLVEGVAGVGPREDDALDPEAQGFDAKSRGAGDDSLDGKVSHASSADVARSDGAMVSRSAAGMGTRQRRSACPYVFPWASM